MDKAKLLASRKGNTKKCKVEGGFVTVRALTRAEAYQLRGKNFDEETLERKTISIAMVDPVLTEDEVGEWQTVAPAGELNDVLNIVTQISGMVKSAGKDAYKSAGE